MSLRDDDRTGLGVSLGAHALIILLLAFAARTPTETLDPDFPPKLVEVEMLFLEPPAPTVPVVQGPPESAPAAAPSDPMQSVEPERPAPPARSPVRIPEQRVETPRPPRPNPLPRPVQQPDARPARPNPPSRATRPEPAPTPRQQTAPTTGAGATQGSSNAPGATEGAGTGSGGDAPAEVGFQFGNRSFDCPSPGFDGIPGSVVMQVTFRPNGSYVTARASGGNPELVRAVQRVVSGCRAQPLPREARQVNQSTSATFVFRAQ